MTTVETLGGNRQLWALITLRWRMIRSARVRSGIAVLACIPLLIVLGGLLGLQSAPDEQRLNLALATPTFYVGFAILTLLAPLFSGGGYELFPSGQLVAYPMRPAAIFRGTLILAPINLAWIINVIALFVVTGFAVGSPAWVPTARALFVVAVFIAVATTVGHTVGWFIMGVRQSRHGRIATNVLGVVIVLGGLALVWGGKVLTALDHSPTSQVLLAAYDGYQGAHHRWAITLSVLVIAAVLMIRAGDAAAGWALRQPGDHADRSASRPQARRSTRTSMLWALVAVDHSSIWRSTPLRRGVLVIVVVPGVIAGLVGMAWQSLILVPGLIAAGAGLLFGINAFTLDSGGAVWLSTLPGWARPAFLAKSLVFAELALGAVLSALIGGSLRAPAPASAADVTAAIASAICCAAIVVAIGMRSSLRHPHRAELQGPRDTPTTPGVMAAQSIRFATVTTLTSLLFAGLALSEVWWLPLIGAVPIMCVAAIHLLNTERAWEHPHVRAHVVLTVAAG
jgi:hypothetical protein